MNSLETKVLDLEKIIGEMCNTFLGFSKDLLISRQVEAEKIKQTTEIFLALSHRASRTLDEEGGCSGEGLEHDPRGDESFSSEMSLKSELPTSLRDLRDPSVNSYFEQVHASLPPRPCNQLAMASRSPNTTEFRVPDPYCNYLWGIPQNSSRDGTSAIPYILAGRDSFASRLYFESIALLVRALQGGASRDIVDSAYRYKRHYVGFDHILGVTTGVLSMLLHGTSQDPKEQRIAVGISELDGPDETAMKAAIARDIVLHGSSETEYLNTWGVERYLRDKWGLGVDSASVRTPPRALEAYSDDISSIVDGELTGQSAFPDSQGNVMPFAPTMVPGFAHTEHALLDAQSLVEKIILGVVSLGEGPRWHVSYIDSAVKAFLQENRS